MLTQTTRLQPWSTYAVFQTTLFQWSPVFDSILVYLYLAGTQEWSCTKQSIGLAMLLSWIFVSKFIKLMGHYVRYPADFLLLPISILFGYLHCLIKARAMISLNVVSDQLAIFHPLNFRYPPGHCFLTRLCRQLGALGTGPMKMTPTG